MNSNFGYSVIPAGIQQPVLQIAPNGGFVAFQPKPQSVPNNNGQFHLLHGVYQPQTVQQGMESFAFPTSQLMPMNGPSATYTCVTQNGLTYLAVTPNIQQPQCYQAVQTPQGLQLFQVVNSNPLNLHTYGVPTPPNAFIQQQPQSVLPLQYSTMQPSEAPTIQTSSFDCQQQLSIQPDELTNSVQYEQINPQNSAETAEEEEPSQELMEELESLENKQENDTRSSVYDNSTQFEATPSAGLPQLNQNVDPLAALTSLTSSISSSEENPLISSIETCSSLPNFPSQMERNQLYNMGDQQFPPNSRAFQVLVPTPQGITYCFTFLLRCLF